MQSREDRDRILQGTWHRPSVLTQTHSYSRDRNLWHISHEGLELEDPVIVSQTMITCLYLSVTPEKAPDEGEYVTMTFEAGVPTTRKRQRNESFRHHHVS